MTARRLEHPALELAEKRTEIKQPTQKWTALQQLGQLPPWELVRNAALKICNGCVLRGCASEITCKECPAVEMLSILMEINDR
jgi:hypothetical protein